MRSPSPAARRAAVRTATAVAALLLALAVLPAATAQPVAHDARAVALSHVDRSAVAVGEAVLLRLEVLAAPTTPAALDTLVAQVRAAQVPTSAAWAVDEAGPLAVRRTGRVVELSRDVTLRALRGGRLEVPAVSLAPGLATRAHHVTAYEASAALASATVAQLDVSGRARGVSFVREGTAFLIAPDVLVTAYHVVAGARRVTVRGPTGRALRARRAWVLDPARDVALLAVDPDEARAAGLVPFALDTTPDAGLATATVRDGRPLVAPRYADVHVDGSRLFASANAVRPGDSGGPLLSARGAVLGVVVSGRTTDGEPDLLREDICLAADVRASVAEALARRARGDRPRRLSRALASVQRTDPAAQAMEAASALHVARPTQAPADHAAALRAAAAMRPDRATLQFLAGSAFEASGRPTDAAAAFASAWASGYVPAAYALAHHHLVRGAPEEALALFGRVQRAAPYRHLGALGVAQAAVAASRYEVAEAALADVLDHDPRFGPALYLLGVVRLAQGRAAEAHALAVRLGPQSEWASGLALLLRAPALRPEALRPLPPVALAGR